MSVTKQQVLAIVETPKEFKGMHQSQRITVYTDHKNLIHDALGLTSDKVNCFQLLLEECGPTIVYIKGINNTVADTIS
jgi:TusA-related sulfurtransferase